MLTALWSCILQMAANVSMLDVHSGMSTCWCLANIMFTLITNFPLMMMLDDVSQLVFTKSSMDATSLLKRGSLASAWTNCLLECLPRKTTTPNYRCTSLLLKWVYTRLSLIHCGSISESFIALVTAPLAPCNLFDDNNCYVFAREKVNFIYRR